MNNTTETHRKAIIGNVNSSFWLYDSREGYDLTHPTTPTSPTIDNAVKIETTKEPIKIDPAKSALVIIDMQNFFLSTALGRSLESKGLEAQKKLLQYAIPAARQVGMRVVWLNWGLTDDDLTDMAPQIGRVFGFETFESTRFEQHLKGVVADSSGPILNAGSGRIETLGKSQRIYCGLGNEMGSVTLENGSEAAAGRLLMRDQWNTQLTPELLGAYSEGLKLEPPDVLIHKNRMSGFWGASTMGTKFLDSNGITTLFFAGVNTDQCVGGTMVDAFSKGFDCILLSDGAATSSPSGSQETYEYNAAGTYGFCTSCENLWNGVRLSKEK